MLNPVHLATLHAVLHNNSFVAAAQDLGYTPSAVSQQMRALERATGLDLFERLPRSIRPTAAAHALADAGRQAVLSLHSLGHDVRALAAGERGHVTIGSFRTASARILPAAFGAFTEKRPSVTVELVEGEPDDLLPDLLGGALDAALVYENDLNPREWPDGLAKVPLLTEDRRLLVPPAHRPRRGTVDLTDLRDWTWVASAPSPSLVRYCAAAGFEPKVALRTNDYHSVCEFVRTGLGIALVPAMGHYNPDVLRPVRLRPVPPKRHVSALHRKSNTSPLLAPLITELRRAAREAAHWGRDTT